jgi:hypothetical protein
VPATSTLSSSGRGWITGAAAGAGTDAAGACTAAARAEAVAAAAGWGVGAGRRARRPRRRARPRLLETGWQQRFLRQQSPGHPAKADTAEQGMAPERRAQQTRLHACAPGPATGPDFCAGTGLAGATAGIATGTSCQLSGRGPPIDQASTTSPTTPAATRPAITASPKARRRPRGANAPDPAVEGPEVGRERVELCLITMPHCLHACAWP